MKKNYQTPAVRVVKLQHRSRMLSGSPYHVQSLGTNFENQDDAIGLGEDENSYFNGGGVIR